jgi:hypothetical protein
MTGHSSQRMSNAYRCAHLDQSIAVIRPGEALAGPAGPFGALHRLAAHRIGDLPDFRFANEGRARPDAARSPDSIRQVARARGIEEEF